MSGDKKKSNILAPVLLNLLNLLQKSDKMLGKSHIFISFGLYPYLFNKFNNTLALM